MSSLTPTDRICSKFPMYSCSGHEIPRRDVSHGMILIRPTLIISSEFPKLMNWSSPAEQSEPHERQPNLNITNEMKHSIYSLRMGRSDIRRSSPRCGASIFQLRNDRPGEEHKMGIHESIIFHRQISDDSRILRVPVGNRNLTRHKCGCRPDHQVSIDQEEFRCRNMNFYQYGDSEPNLRILSIYKSPQIHIHPRTSGPAGAFIQ
jgi:hypothetical protein